MMKEIIKSRMSRKIKIIMVFIFLGLFVASCSPESPEPQIVKDINPSGDSYCFT